MERHTMESRLNRLERQNRSLRRLVFSVCLLAGLATVAGAVSQESRVVEAERFVLRDAAGARRAVLTVIDGRAALALLRDERPRLVLTESEDFVGLTMHNGEGVSRVTLGAVAENAAFFVNDDKGQPRAVLAVGKDGQPGLELHDAGDKPTFHAP